MDFLHKEFINKEHIYSVITQALNDGRKLYCRHHNDDEHHEVQIYCVKMTDANLYFKVEDSSRFKVQINNFLVIQFTVRHENKFLPCEISVRVKSSRLTQGQLYFYTSFPISIRHKQHRLFARYPVTADCFSQKELAFTDTDYFYQDKWKIFMPELVDYGNISIGGIMIHLTQHESWEKMLTYNSTLILSCVFKTDDSHITKKQLNAFHIAATILSIQQLKDSKIKQIHAKFSHWTYQHNISWRRLEKNCGIESMAKFLFQYAYRNKLPTD